PPIVRRDEHLRIVSDQLWQAAHARMKTTAAAYLRHPNGQVWSRPETGLESRHLLVGFMEDETCGGSFFVRRAAHSYYCCTQHHLRGARACGNRLTMRREEADAAVLATLRDDILNPQVIALAVETTIARYTGRPG